MATISKRFLLDYFQSPEKKKKKKKKKDAED
jgi:hypothetical protein